MRLSLLTQASHRLWQNNQQRLPFLARNNKLHCFIRSSTFLRVWTANASVTSVGLAKLADSVGPCHSEESVFDSIAAIVTGAQQGAVSIIRISGDGATDIARNLFRPPGHKTALERFASHRVYYGNVLDADGSTIDEVLLLCMLAPRSYTAEDVIEIHTHGGGICAQRVLRRCLECGARLAKPGEFTLRAFLNGRLDLSQAESVAQLIDARTVAAADSALAGLAGGLGQEVTEMRAECIELLTEMDARLDFDEDLPPLDVDALAARIEVLSQRVQRTLSTARQGQLLRSGLQVALVGRPNVGKSSLLNALSGTERAIVTEIAGTTRDIVEAGLVMGGVPITLLDTAGLRESSDKVERIGVERSLAAAKQADIVLMVMDAQMGWTLGDQEIFRTVFQGVVPGSSTVDSYDPYSSGDSADSLDLYSPDAVSRSAASTSGPCRTPAVLVVNKVDLSQDTLQNSGLGAAKDGQTVNPCASGNPGTCQGSDSEGDVPAPTSQPGSSSTTSRSINGSSRSLVPPEVGAAFRGLVHTSAATGAGLEDLKEAVLKLAGAPEIAPGGMAWAVNERQSEALIRADEALGRVKQSVAEGLPVDFWTIDLREAVMALGEVNGEEVTEEVLDNIFSKFCIGK